MTDKNKTDNEMASPSCPLPIANSFGRSEVDEKVHERFWDTLKTKGGIPSLRKSFSTFLWKEQHFYLPYLVIGILKVEHSCGLNICASQFIFWSPNSHEMDPLRN